MAWKNLAEDLAEEFGEHVFELTRKSAGQDSDRDPVASVYRLNSSSVLEGRRLLTKTKHTHAQRTGMCIVCGVRPIKPRRGGKSIHCSRACQVRGDQKYRTRVAA